jgi:putative heme-binding domain-containing protein
VRREVALALRDVPYDQCHALLIQLADGFDGRDRWYLEAWGTACDRREDAVYESMLNKSSVKSPLDWDDRFATLVWRLHPPQATAALLVRARADRLDAMQRRQAIDTLAFIPIRQAAEAMATIAAGGPEDQRAAAQWWIDFRRHNLWQHQRDVFPPERLDQNPQPTVQSLASPPASHPGNSLKLPPLAELAQLKGDAARGRQLVFGRAECAKCHRFADEGKTVGPDLSSIGRKLDRAQLLDSILNPSAAIALGYETWLLATTDGRLLSGFIIGEGDTVFLKDSEGRQHAVAADQIESRQQQTISLMPEVGTLGLTSQDLADIAEFLSRQRSDPAAVHR